MKNDAYFLKDILKIIQVFYAKRLKTQKRKTFILIFHTAKNGVFFKLNG